MRGPACSTLPGITATILEYSPRLKLDLTLYRPNVTSPLPLLLFLHAGGLQVGSRDSIACARSGCGTRGGDYVLPVQDLMEAGIAVASASYRLCTNAQETVWPGQLEDVREAVAFLRSNAASLGLRHKAIGCYGISAGAGLCAALAVTQGTSFLPRAPAGSHVRMGVSISGWADFFVQDRARGYVRGTSSGCGNSVPVCAAGGAGFLKRWQAAGNQSKVSLTELPEELQERLRSASLARAVAEHRPTVGGAAAQTVAPLLLVHGDQDSCHPLDNALALQEAALAVGAPSTVELLRVHGGRHTVACAPPSVREQTMRFVRSHLLGGDGGPDERGRAGEEKPNR